MSGEGEELVAKAEGDFETAERTDAHLRFAPGCRLRNTG
jgi:hypothetical protein